MKLAYHFIIALGILLTSCSSWSSETNQALKMAGENREELEKVLLHYSQNEADSLKLKAAEFLISNMVYQYTQEGEGVNNLNRMYQYVAGAPNSLRGKMLRSDSVIAISRGSKALKFDLLSTKSETLINQIEIAFDIYDSFSWSRDYPFTLFCEYVLPYKIGHSMSENWREYAIRQYSSKREYLDWERGARYELENYCIDSCLMVHDSTTSSDEVVAVQLGKNSIIQLPISVKENHDYQRFVFSCYSRDKDASALEIKVNNEIRAISMPGNIQDHRLGQHHLIEFYLKLDSGQYVMEFKGKSDSLFLDYLELPKRLEQASANVAALSHQKYLIRNNQGYIKRVGDKLENGTLLSLTTDSSEATAVRIRPAMNGTYTLLIDEEGSTTRVFDAGIKSDTSSKVHLWFNYGNANQRWAIISDGNEGYRIHNMWVDKVLSYSEKTGLLNLVQDDSRDQSVWIIESVEEEGSMEAEMDTIGQLLREAQAISELSNEFKWHNVGTTMGAIDPIYILKYKYGTCSEETSLQTMLLRAFGIASTTDFVFNWAERGSGHSWSVIFDLDGRVVQNNCHHPVGAKTEAVDFKKGKVYRRTGSINRESLFSVNNGKDILPPEFVDPYFVDVTPEYCNTYDFDIQIAYPHNDNNQFAYLLVRNYSDWVVTGWGRSNGESVNYKDVEAGVVYLPAFYINNQFTPINAPFYLDSLGAVQFLKVDSPALGEVVVKRKFPNRTVNNWHHDRIIGGKFQGANSSDFSDATTLGVIDSTMLEPLFHSVNINTPQGYKYFRYIGPDGAHCNINEIVLYDVEGDTIPGEIIGTSGSRWNDDQTIERVFDGDVLTYFNAPQPNGSWVGLGFDEPKEISRIRFATRNDGNMVEVGNEYELVYWDREWKSLGSQIATCDSLVYGNAPSGVLYLLHNHTKGKEERPFTIEDGKQVWW